MKYKDKDKEDKKLKTILQFKRVYAFLRCLPVLLKGIKELWDMLREIYNEETMKEIKETAEQQKQKDKE